MAQDANKAGLKVYRWNEDEVFLIVSDPMRRRIVRALANGDWKTALELGVGPGNKRHTILKHFKVLSKFGVLVQKENPKDRRQPLYALSPSVVICQTENAVTADFSKGMLCFAKR